MQLKRNHTRHCVHALMQPRPQGLWFSSTSFKMASTLTKASAGLRDTISASFITWHSQKTKAKWEPTLSSKFTLERGNVMYEAVMASRKMTHYFRWVLGRRSLSERIWSRAEKGRAVKRAVRSWANVWCEKRTGTNAPSALPVQLMAAKNLLSTNRKCNFLSLFWSHQWPVFKGLFDIFSPALNIILSVWTSLKKFLTCLYDLDLFTLNTVLDCNLNPDNQSFVRIPSRYYSPHSFRQMKTKVETDTSFLFFTTT